MSREQPNHNDPDVGRGRGWGVGRQGNGGGRGSPFESSSSSSSSLWGGGSRGRGRGGYTPMGGTYIPPHLRQGNGGVSSPRGRGWGGTSPSYGSCGSRWETDSPRHGGRGRGNSHYIPIPDDPQGPPNMDMPSRDGSNSSRGRGRGNFASMLRAGAPLSKVWYADRPLLRPIEFVRSLHTATLFQEEEEILQPVVEELVSDNKQNHVPTAVQVTRPFSGGVDSGSDDGEELEEIDFADIGNMQAAVDAAAMNIEPGDWPAGVSTVKERFTGFYIDAIPAPLSGAIAHDFRASIVGEEAEDDETIKYDTPNPHAGPPVPVFDAAQGDLVTAAEAPSMGSNPTMLPVETSKKEVTGNVVAVGQVHLEGTPAGIEIDLSVSYTLPTSDASTLFDEKPPILLRKEPILSSSMSKVLPSPSFSDVMRGTIAQTPKGYMRRIHPVGTPRSLWGSGRSEKKERTFTRAALRTMLSETVQSVLSEVYPRSEQQRSDSDDDDTSGEEERMIMGHLESGIEGALGSNEDDDGNEGRDGGAGGVAADIEGDDNHGEDEDGDEESDDEEEAVEGNLQARLPKTRSKEKGKAQAVASEDDDDDMEMDLQGRVEDSGDEEPIAEVQVLSSNDSPAKGKTSKGIPPELHGPREKERQRITSGPATSKWGQEEDSKTRLKASRDEEEDDKPPLPNIFSLEQTIRHFAIDPNTHSLELPPFNKNTRVQVHGIAIAFNLKSQSQGFGKERFITLTKTARSGVDVNEEKIARMLRMGDRSRDRDIEKRKKIKQRDGEEVGKSAPKIGESNVGFQMLAAMGWSEGDRIGFFGGLDVPLKVIMKKTKRGLGAL